MQEEEEEEKEVTIAATLYPSVGMVFLLVPQGLDGTGSLGGVHLCEQGWGVLISPREWCGTHGYRAVAMTWQHPGGGRGLGRVRVQSWRGRFNWQSWSAAARRGGCTSSHFTLFLGRLRGARYGAPNTLQCPQLSPL